MNSLIYYFMEVVTQIPKRGTSKQTFTNIYPSPKLRPKIEIS